MEVARLSGWPPPRCELATEEATPSPKLRWYQQPTPRPRKRPRATQAKKVLNKRRRLEANAVDASSRCSSMVGTTDDTSSGLDSSESVSLETSSYDSASDAHLPPLEEDNFDDLLMSGMQQDLARKRAAAQSARRAFQQRACARKEKAVDGRAVEDSDQEDFQPPFGQVRVCIPKLRGAHSARACSMR